MKLTRKEMNELRGGFLPPCDICTEVFTILFGFCTCGCQLVSYNWYSVGTSNSVDGITSPQCVG